MTCEPLCVRRAWCGAQVKTVLYDAEHDELTNTLLADDAGRALSIVWDTSLKRCVGPSLSVAWDTTALDQRALVLVEQLVMKKLPWRSGAAKAAQRSAGKRSAKCCVALFQTVAGMSVHRQLTVIFCFAAVVIWAVLVGLGTWMVLNLMQTFLSDTRAALVNQLVLNSQLVMDEASRVLSARMHIGTTALALPVVFTYFDVTDSSTFSVEVCHPTPHQACYSLPRR